MVTHWEGSYIRRCLPTPVTPLNQAKLYLGFPCWPPSMMAGGEGVNMDVEHLLKFADLC